MTERRASGGLDFEALRRAIEGSDTNSMLDFYAEGARVRVLNGTTLPFDLNGRAEISRYLRAAFRRPTTHRVRNAVVGQSRITFEDLCEYADGASLVVATTLEVRGSEILHQLDVVSLDAKSPGREPGNPSGFDPEPTAEQRGGWKR